MWGEELNLSEQHYSRRLADNGLGVQGVKLTWQEYVCSRNLPLLVHIVNDARDNHQARFT